MIREMPRMRKCSVSLLPVLPAFINSAVLTQMVFMQIAGPGKKAPLSSHHQVHRALIALKLYNPMQPQLILSLLSEITPQPD